MVRTSSVGDGYTAVNELQVGKGLFGDNLIAQNNGSHLLPVRYRIIKCSL